MRALAHTYTMTGNVLTLETFYAHVDAWLPSS